MVESSGIPGESRARLREMGAADIVVGIPSFRNEATIGQVVRAAAEGLLVHFPDLKSVIVNSDGGSSDNTHRVFASADVPTSVDKLAMLYKGLPGKGSACRAILEAAVQLKAKACVLVDADLRSLTPQWIEGLAGPVLREGYDFVAPFYRRHKHDGTITNNIAYPMTRALYGLRVRQPIGGDFGLSGRLASRLLEKDVWETDVARFGIDIWMTTTAVNGGYRVCQTYLGVKVHDAKDPAASLGPMFAQVVGTLFGLMDAYKDSWVATKDSRPIATYGATKHGEPEAVAVTVQAMIDKFRAGAQELKLPWRKMLSSQSYNKVMERVDQTQGKYAFPADLWAAVVYDFAVAYRAPKRIGVSPAQVIQALTPLYFARTAGMVLESAEMDAEQFEEAIEEQGIVFERLKPYLIKRWSRFE